MTTDYSRTSVFSVVFDEDFMNTQHLSNYPLDFVNKLNLLYNDSAISRTFSCKQDLNLVFPLKVVQQTTHKLFHLIVVYFHFETYAKNSSFVHFLII